MSTEKEVSFWACVVIANLSQNTWAIAFWIVMALVIRVPYWLSVLKGKP